jgi:lysophospholipase L1-like esterase
MITYKLKINYQEARLLNSDMEFVTGDIGAYRLEFEFYDNGSRDNLAGKLLTVRARRADGVCYASNGEIVDNIGVFVPKNNIYAVPGDLCLEIALSDSAGNYVTTKIITASVIDGIGDVANGAQDDVSIYVTLLAQIKAQIDEANKLVDRANLSIDSHTEDKANPHGVTKAQVGLSNVDNTKDADKPVSTATQAALNLKANASEVYYKNVLYTKNETDAKLALKANSADIYTKSEVDEKVSSVSIWGGAVSSWEGLPANPKPGTYCYVSSDIANGVKYSGKVSELFRFEPPEFAFPYPSTVWFTPPDECLGDTDFSETQKQVKIYTKSGSEAGSLWVTYEAYPQGVLDVTQLGATSADDTVTFYLGYWDGTSFPAKIDVFPAGSMIFWNGTEWCGVASADLAGEVSGKADKIKTNPHGGIYGYPLIVTDHLAGEGPISLKVYGAASDGVGDLVASGDYTGKYAIPITIRGKNLFSTKSIQNTTSTINGITWTINDDGSITANGTATANSHYNAVKQADAILFPAGDYSFSTTYEHYNQIQFKIITYVDGAATILTQTLGMDSPVFTLTDDTYLCFQCTIGSGKTLNNVTIYPRIEYGKVLTEYEPYGISAEKTVYTDVPLTEGESVEITDIVMPESAKLFISANTTVPPSGMELLYYQDMNKLVGEFASGAHPLMGKKILCLGDSIFGAKNTEVSEFFKSITKANVYNCALGGTRMAQHEEGWDNWSMYRFAYSIANNDWAIQENGLTHTNVPPFAEERLAFIKTLDFNDIDVITINHGTNDWSGSITLDNDSNPLDTTTYMGALRYSIETILTAYPHLKIVVLSPCWRYWNDSDGNFANDSNTRTNTLGEALVSYVSKGKEVAESYQLDWVDLYHIGFNKFTTSIYFPSTDTTHPNNTGRLAIAKKMSECIRV